MVDTAFLQTGDHELILRLIDNNGSEETMADSNEAYSKPVPVKVENPIFFFDYKAPRVGWKLALKFGTPETNGTWDVHVYDESSNLWAYAEGNIATSKGEDGGIVLEDPYIDDGYGGYRYRNYYDEYPNEFLDVVYRVTPAGQSAVPKIKVTRNRVKKLPPYRIYCVAEDPQVLPRPGGYRGIMDEMMEVVLQSMSPLGSHFELQNMTPNLNPPIHSEGWNKLSVTQNWFRLNAFIAGYTNSVYPTRVRGTHLFTVSHGWSEGIGGSPKDPGHQVSASTLEALGYWYVSNVTFVITGPPPYSGTIQATLPYSDGFRFVFLDACETMRGSIVQTLLEDSGLGSVSKVTLSDIDKYGLVPHYGCGWNKTKIIGARTSSDVDWDHSVYITVFFSEVMKINPGTGLPYRTYRQARERAKYRLTDPSAWNPACTGYDYAGCDQLYIDE